MDLQQLTNIIESYTRESVDRLNNLVVEADDIFLIGNGGSNAIASHMAVDYSKFLSKRCYVPNASDLMSMIVNDYGSASMYSTFISYYHRSNTNQLAILISSSGNSVNICNAAEKCIELGIPMILLSGFDEGNKLNSYQSDNIKYKLWVNSTSYGVVEMAHHVYLHSII